MAAYIRRSELPVEPLRTLSLRSAGGPGRPRFLAAASGIVVTGGRLYVIADDELHLGCFGLDGGRPGNLLRLLPGELPAGASRRKQRKADFEALLKLPPCADLRHGALLALGSGSRPRRRVGVLVPLDAALRPAHCPVRIDAAPLFAGLERRFGEVNIEGGWTWNDRFYLLQRGNRSGVPNALLGWKLAPLLRKLAVERALPGQLPDFVREMPLGNVDGVAVGFTDGTPLPDGGWMFSAVAEDTGDAYRDGRFAGAFVGRVGPRHALKWMRRIVPGYKIEGIAIDSRSRVPRLLLVSDADDPARPAWLLAAKPG